MPPNARLQGIALLALSTLIFAFSNVLAKYLTADYPIGEALVIRSLIALILMAPFVRATPIIAALRAEPGLHALRMVLTAAEIYCFYYAVSLLQLADVTTFYLAGPLMLTATSAIVLHEQVSRARWLATVAGFVGVVVALRPSAGAVSLPALIALLGAAMYSVVLLATRSLRRTPNTVLVPLQLVSLLLAGAITLPFAWTTPTLTALGLMIVVGTIAIGGYVCVNRALALAPASVVAPFQYLSLVWAITGGYLAFQDIPDHATLAGAAIIVAAGLFTLLLERQDTKGTAP